MSLVLVTGSNGLLGANVCKILLERGHTVRALVRSTIGAEPLAALGAELHVGDITDVESLRAAGAGVDAVVHSAALIGGAGQDREEFWQVNGIGSRNVLDIAPAGRTVLISTFELYSGAGETITEKTEIPADGPQDPYATAKRFALQTGLERAANGQHVSIVLPGGIYGPSPVVARSFSTNSYNRVIRGGLRGKLPQYVAFPAPWVHVNDVAMITVRAVEAGVSGSNYLALGRAEEVLTTAAMITLACELAGVPHRSADLHISPENRDEIERIYGPSLVDIAELYQNHTPDPLFDDTYTRESLGVTSTPLREGLTDLIGWMREQGQLDAPARKGA